MLANVVASSTTTAADGATLLTEGQSDVWKRNMWQFSQRVDSGRLAPSHQHLHPRGQGEHFSIFFPGETRETCSLRKHHKNFTLFEVKGLYVSPFSLTLVSFELCSPLQQPSNAKYHPKAPVATKSPSFPFGRTRDNHQPKAVGWPWRYLPDAFLRFGIIWFDYLINLSSQTVTACKFYEANQTSLRWRAAWERSQHLGTQPLFLGC